MNSIKRALGLLVILALTGLTGCSSDDDPVVAPPIDLTTLDTQAKIDAFGAEGRTVFAERLVIGVENQPNRSITDLSPLSDLTFVGGLTVFYNDLLGDLTGLDNLVGIGGSLVIAENPKLTGLAALAGVSAFGGGITIRKNDLLENLTGLDNLTTVEGDILIEDNEKLRLFGTESVRTVSGDIIIRGNDSIGTVGHWSDLETVGGDYIIHENPRLSFVNISDLQTIGGDYSVQANEIMNVIRGAGVDVNGDVGVVDNPLLVQIAGLNAIGGTLLIQRNEDLFALDSLASLASIGGALFLLDNSVLTDFCGLVPFMRAGFSGSFAAVGNAVNPTVGEIRALAPCP